MSGVKIIVSDIDVLFVCLKVNSDVFGLFFGVYFGCLLLEQKQKKSSSWLLKKSSLSSSAAGCRRFASLASKI